jgi:hypothetical protein
MGGVGKKVKKKLNLDMTNILTKLLKTLHPCDNSHHYINTPIVQF